MYEGMPIGMVYGFASTLLHTIEQLSPDGIFVTFDTKEKTFRHDMDENYKAQREKAPDDFYPQIPYIFELLESFGIPALTSPGFESDDIIGTISQKAVQGGFDVKILSNDHDFLQLVNDHIKLVKFNGKSDHPLIYGRAETKTRYGVFPEQVVDFKALTGDSSDNYKGVEGIGPKNAALLLEKFGTIEGIFENIDTLTPSLQSKLSSQKDYLNHCRELACIHTHTPVEYDLQQEFRFFPDRTLAFLEKFRFRALEVRYQKLIKKIAQQKNTDQKSDTKKDDTEEQMSLFIMNNE